MHFFDIINALLASAASFAKANPVIAAVALVVLAFLVYRKPLLFLFLLCLGLLLAGVFYVIMDTAGSSTPKKERMIQKRAVPENTFRPGGMKF